MIYGEDGFSSKFFAIPYDSMPEFYDRLSGFFADQDFVKLFRVCLVTGRYSGSAVAGMVESVVSFTDDELMLLESVLDDVSAYYKSVSDTAGSIDIGSEMGKPGLQVEYEDGRPFDFLHYVQLDDAVNECATGLSFLQSAVFCEKRRRLCEKFSLSDGFLAAVEQSGKKLVETNINGDLQDYVNDATAEVRQCVTSFKDDSTIGSEMFSWLRNTEYDVGNRDWLVLKEDFIPSDQTIYNIAVFLYNNEFLHIGDTIYDNPMLDFREDDASGLYEHLPNKEYQVLYHDVEVLASLWEGRQSMTFAELVSSAAGKLTRWAAIKAIRNMIGLSIRDIHTLRCEGDRDIWFKLDNVNAGESGHLYSMPADADVPDGFTGAGDDVVFARPVSDDAPKAVRDYAENYDVSCADCLDDDGSYWQDIPADVLERVRLIE